MISISPDGLDRMQPLPELHPLHMHVGLTECKGVDVGLVVQVRQAVIDETMCGLIATDSVDDVQ